MTAPVMTQTSQIFAETNKCPAPDTRQEYIVHRKYVNHMIYNVVNPVDEGC